MNEGSYQTLPPYVETIQTTVGLMLVWPPSLHGTAPPPYPHPPVGPV